MCRAHCSSRSPRSSQSQPSCHVYGAGYNFQNEPHSQLLYKEQKRSCRAVKALLGSADGKPGGKKRVEVFYLKENERIWASTWYKTAFAF